MSVSNFFRQKQKRVWVIAASAMMVAAVLIVAVTLAILVAAYGLICAPASRKADVREE